MKSDSKWERPKTTKLYLQPPMAERMLTLWPDFKIINSEIRDDTVTGAKGCGFMILVGEDMRQIPWEKAVFTVRDDGIPVYTVGFDTGSFLLSMETFCSMDRNPINLTKITVKNYNLWPVCGCISLLPRTGSEIIMMGINHGGYCSYEPSAEAWGMIPTDWQCKDTLLTDGEFNISIQNEGSIECKWQGILKGNPFYTRNLMKLNFDLDVDSEASVIIGFYKGKECEFDYENEKRKAINGWNKELQKIKTYPKTDRGIYHKMYKNLVVQLLQMLCVPEGRNSVFPRQGGIERGVWPAEAVEFLTTLDRIGDFKDYTRLVYDFFGEIQVKEGEDRGRVLSVRSAPWAGNTGAVLWGLSRHIIAANSVEELDHFKDILLCGYEWINRMRKKTLSGNFAVKGLFPPMQSSDWNGAYQSWCWTDAWNIMGLEKLSEMLELFHDERAEEIKQSYRDYKKVMTDYLGEIAAHNNSNDEIMISNRAGIEPSDPPCGPYFSDGPANLIRAKIIDPKSFVFRQAEAYFRNRSLMRNGLCGLMTDGLLHNGCPSDKWAGHTWYTSFPDLCWFYGWMENGEFEKAGETFFAQIKYSMTKEFYMQERYAENDPSFVPWQPNASANGRFIMMMLDYFANKK